MSQDGTEEEYSFRVMHELLPRKMPYCLVDHNNLRRTAFYVLNEEVRKYESLFSQQDAELSGVVLWNILAKCGVVPTKSRHIKNRQLRSPKIGDAMAMYSGARAIVLVLRKDFIVLCANKRLLQKPDSEGKDTMSTRYEDLLQKKAIGSYHLFTLGRMSDAHAILTFAHGQSVIKAYLSPVEVGGE